MQNEQVRDYLERRFLPALGIAGRGVEVSPPRRPGTRSQVLILTVEGLGPVLMRTWNSRATARRNVAALRHLDQVGLPAPRLVYQDLAVAARWIRVAAGGPAYVTIETFVEGDRLSDLEEGPGRQLALDAAASLLRRYRLVTRPVWGRPDREATGSWMGHALAGARRMMREVRGAGWLSGEDHDSILSTLASWSAEIDRLTPFSLVHKDVNGDNLILTSTGEVIAIDLHRLAYEPFPEELLNAARHLMPDQPERAARFAAIYFGDGSEGARETFERTRGFFEPFYALKRLYRLVGRDAGHPGWREREGWTASLLEARSPRGSRC